MPSQINCWFLVLASTLITPSLASASDTFSYDFYEVEISSTTEDGGSYTSLGASGSMEINNEHYITAQVKTDIADGVTANEIGVGIGAYKSSSESTDYYSRAGFTHGKDNCCGSAQTLSVGFGARHELSDSIELTGGIDLLFSTAEESSGVSGNLSALYNFNETTQIGGGVESDGDKTEARFFTRIKML
ncbi:MAG: hypothetical protein ACPG47_02330 [Leucothrix sp.]